jgi:hypothetical protein
VHSENVCDHHGDRHHHRHRKKAGDDLRLVSRQTGKELELYERTSCATCTTKEGAHAQETREGPHHTITGRYIAAVAEHCRDAKGMGTACPIAGTQNIDLSRPRKLEITEWTIHRRHEGRRLDNIHQLRQCPPWPGPGRREQKRAPTVVAPPTKRWGDRTAGAFSPRQPTPTSILIIRLATCQLHILKTRFSCVYTIKAGETFLASSQHHCFSKKYTPPSPPYPQSFGAFF